MPYRPVTRVRCAHCLALLLLLGTTPAAFAALQTFNSPGTDIDATREAWLLASGIASVQHEVDFEAGFSDGQDVSGLTGLFPGGITQSRVKHGGKQSDKCPRQGDDALGDITVCPAGAAVQFALPGSANGHMMGE